jgi:flagellar protein FliO/FliZ
MVVSALAAWQPSLSSHAGVVERSGYGEMLAVSLGLVAVVCVVAVVLVRVLGRRGPGRTGDLIEVIARQPLEPRRSLYVVRAGRKTLLLGSSEQGVTMLAELESLPELADGAASLVASPAAAGRGAASFGELVRQAAERWSARRGLRKPGGAPEPAPLVPAELELLGSEEPARPAKGEAAGQEAS